MRYRTLAAMASVLILIGLLLGGLSPAAARQSGQPGLDGPPAPEFKAGEVLVKFRAGRVSASAAEGIRGDNNAERIRLLYNSDVELWRVPEGQEATVVQTLNGEPAIEYAELNYRYYILDVPNDPRYVYQWAHPIMQSPAAWDLSTGSATMTIAIVDSGIDENHPDLAAKIVPGYDFVDKDEDPHDLNGHGTHCAGIAAAVTDNATGIAGMDWQARIMPVRTIEADGTGWASDLVEGIIWAYSNGAKVISLSLGITTDYPPLQDAVNSAHTAGSLIVAAMGNYREQGNPTMYPAAHNNVMAVAATARDDLYAHYSQWGDHCDIAAPGGETRYSAADGILSTLPTYDGFYLQTKYGYSKNYDYLQGTSMATPYVAGLAALVWSLNPALTPDQVQATIEGTATDRGIPGWDQDYGWGRINAYRALLSQLPPTLSAISNPDGDGNYTVQWSEVPLAGTYTLQEDDNGAFSSPTVRYSGPGRQTTITGQGPGTWYYRVRSSSTVAGDGDWSNVQSTAVKPNPPTLYSISNPTPTDEYVVSWSSSATATSYTLEEDDNSLFSTPKTRYVGNSLSYNVTGQPGGTWYYRVFASSSAGTSSPSNNVSTTVAASPLSAPILTIDNADGNDSYSVTWTDVGSTNYVLEESPNPYFDAPTIVYQGPDTQHGVTGQPKGTWHYRVRAFESSTVKSPWSNTQAATVTTWIYLPLIANKLPIAAPAGLINGTFEQGVTGWLEYSSQDWPLILSTSFPHTPHSGTWAVWLGGALSEISYIEQQVTIPSGAPHLHYWYWIESTDDCGYDFANIRVNGTAVKTHNLCSAENTGGWAEASADLATYARQSVSLQIHVTNDSLQSSSLYVDDVSLLATAVVEQMAEPAAGEIDTPPTKLERDPQR